MGNPPIQPNPNVPPAPATPNQTVKAPVPITSARQTTDVLQARSCPHCGATGTCRNGKDEMSCASCVRYFLNANALSNRDEQADKTPLELKIVTKCSVCIGRGFTEGMTYKIRSYFPFGFAVLFIGIAFLAIWHLPDSDDKLKSSLMTLIGTIVGFYFGGKVSS
jgi:hypothetical protein